MSARTMESQEQEEMEMPSFDHDPLLSTARGREAHGRDAALGRALLAEREERGRRTCTRERDCIT
eukprot:357565-Chlamydomonas_euryale.AAC.1